MIPKFHLIKALLSDLPTHPGVYQMLNADGVIIYIGKANNIKKRVSQYFLKNRDYKTRVMIDEIDSIAPIITKNEHEALILENQLIKQYQPRFNVLLKDDKSYPYIKITMNEAFPRILITRQRKNDGALYFGPYTSYGSSKKLKQLLYDIFPIRDCKQTIDPITKQKKCIKLDIGKCIGPCIYKNITTEYHSLIQQCIDFLKGNSANVIDKLAQEMLTLSSEKNYEKAAVVRDKIQRLESIQAQQHVELETNHHYFVIGFSTNEHFHYVACQHFSKKIFISQNGHYAPTSTTFETFFRLFFEPLIITAPTSSTFILSDPILEMARPFISTLKKKISLISPKKGRHFELLTLAQLNAQKSLIGLSKQVIKQSSIPPLELLKNDLGLPKIPIIIFGCDISHYYGKDIVSSVVVFIDGKPHKPGYRHFNIKSVVTGKSNDVKAMKETVSRLIEHFDTPPDLLLIDGGKGQLNAALDAIKTSHGKGIACVALAKKNESIYTPFKSTPLQLAYHHAGLNLLRHVRDEAHRFALKFQRSKRYKSVK